MREEIVAMPTEAEKRLHRCCFSGHRSEKLDVPEDEVREWLVSRIDEAIAAGYRTFICGMAMGVDIIAGQIVRAKKEKVKGSQKSSSGLTIQSSLATSEW